MRPRGRSVQVGWFGLQQLERLKVLDTLRLHVVVDQRRDQYGAVRGFLQQPPVRQLVHASCVVTPEACCEGAHFRAIRCTLR